MSDNILVHMQDKSLQKLSYANAHSASRRRMLYIRVGDLYFHLESNASGKMSEVAYFFFVTYSRSPFFPPAWLLVGSFLFLEIQ